MLTPNEPVLPFGGS